jgi:hypothetical protein
MIIANTIIIISLFSIISVSLVYPFQLIQAQILNSNSTQANTTTTNSQAQWKVYTNDKFGFSVEYPPSWIISEKQNRFESGVEAAIESPDLGGSNYGSFVLADASPSATSNIRILTNLFVNEVIGGFDADYEKRLIERANLTKYKFSGERTGAFTYVLDRKDFTDGETTTTPVTAIEVVTAIHDGKSYLFSFLASTENFDNPTLSEIRQHMFNSIKWKDS